MSNSIVVELIATKIFEIRCKKVMLDRDLAKLDGVETRALNQAVKRNQSHFPEDFMFNLTREEINRILQFVISLKFSKNVYAFTEQGVAMLSSVLDPRPRALPRHLLGATLPARSAHAPLNRSQARDAMHSSCALNCL
jgi:hypothetical protein